mmetsp:Transcript_21198/g.23998  ORF Transcript_21198/g.23998 Transcript_21198/m.23998 type:complete len:294 (-) Transcript_21198:179-1060(-)
MDELKDLVIQSLETKGILGRIRAELRSTVFKIIDNPDSVSAESSSLNAHNSKVQEISKNVEAKLAAEMIREFMDYYKMDYSLNVFVPESNLAREGRGKDELAADAGIQHPREEPLLVSMIKAFKSGDVERVPQGDLLDSREDDEMFESNDSRGKKKNLPLLTDETMNKLAPLGTKENPIETTSADKAKLREIEARMEKMEQADNLFENRHSHEEVAGNDRYVVENDLEVDDDIDEDLDHFEESDDFVPDYQHGNKDDVSGGVSVSQSIGIDGTVDSVALEAYDFIEGVEKPRH